MGRLTEWGLRRQAERDGHPISGKQFRDCVKWGILAPPDDHRRWDEAIVKRLVHWQVLGASIRSLPRRALRLFCEGVPVPNEQGDLVSEGVPVPPAKVREAMIAIIPSIDHPARTMKRVLRARLLLGNPALSAVSPAALNRSMSRAGQLPRADQWIEIINRADSALIEAHHELWAYLTNAIRSLPFDTAVKDIQPEEILTTLAIQDIAADEALRASAAVEPVIATKGRTAAERQAIRELATQMEPARENQVN